MIKTIKLKGLDNKEVKVPAAENRDYPTHLLKPHFLLAIIGNRGSGKTSALYNLIKFYDQTRTFDKVVFFCPTFQNDSKYQLFKQGAYELHVLGEYSDEAFQKVWDEIKRDLDEWKEYQRKMALWEKLLKVKNLDELKPDELLELDAMGYEEPASKYGREPFTLLVFDDCHGNEQLYRSNAKGLINRFIVTHRHYRCSCIFVSQVYHNGISRQIRNNLSSLMLFKNKNDQMRKQIADEFSGIVKPDTFVEMWDRSTAEPHEFFMIDFDTRDKTHRFRKSFNELLVAD